MKFCRPWITLFTWTLWIDVVIFTARIMIPTTFINYAADVLGDTDYGLKGSKIAKLFSKYSLELDVDTPHSEYPFNDLPNKRSALRENLKRKPKGI